MKHETFYIVFVLALISSAYYLVSYPIHQIAGQEVLHVQGRKHACEVPCVWVGNASMVADIHLVSLTGYGRTGNYFRSIRKAIYLGHLCQKRVKLPASDDASGALPINETFSRLDFSARHGVLPKVCEHISFPIHGDASVFWALRDNIGNSTTLQGLLADFSSPDLSLPLQPCIANYLGICNMGYCSPDKRDVLGDSVLVAHVREGDVFKPDHTSVPAPCYGQPPLSYYLQAMYDKRWAKVIIVGESGTFGPTRSALRSLNESGVFSGLEIVFQASLWSNDLETLLCARNVVTSRSSLIPLINLGFASRIYSYSCISKSFSKVHMMIPISNYPHWAHHDGGKIEWLDTLLTQSGEPETCVTDSPSPKEPEECLPMWSDGIF